MDLFSFVTSCKEISSSLQKLHSLTPVTSRIQKALEFSIGAHKEQYRKSGEPYAVHPICVACIVAYYGGDEAMICSALLHDVVEDTHFSLDEVRCEFGDEVAQIVDALTKIVELREENIPKGIQDAKILAQASSFRKVLLASIKDVRAIFVKICDRLHNMLTLDALSEQKQRKISEETLVVYAPIAYRLGISSIKNALEDRSFYYLLREEHNKIQAFLGENHLILKGKLEEFVQKMKNLLVLEGFQEESFQIQSRLKRPYSIYLKMQRKGVGVEEILDLLAIRIIVQNSIDCYRVLGLVHLHFKPITSRFKDYIAIPKENGYQTIHTTVFDKRSIFEVQIRTFDMQKSAEFGLAAHWKYKMGNQISLDWLSNIEYKDQDIGEFYELVKSDLYREDIAVFSPRGDVYSLPAGSVVLDFAYAVHTELGESAIGAYVNHQKANLLERLKNGDIVRIVTGETSGMRCSWIDLVKTSKAKNRIRISCQNKLREINLLIVMQILKTFFGKTYAQIQSALSKNWINPNAILSEAEIKDASKKLVEYFYKSGSLLSRLRYLNWELQEYEIDNLKILSHKPIDGILYDYCCYPKQGDEVMGILENQKVLIHHKLCEKAKIQENTKMVFVDWTGKIGAKYKIVIILEDTRGALARFLTDLAKYGCNLTGIFYKGYQDQFLTHFEVDVEVDSKIAKELKNGISSKYKIVEFQNLKDAYR
ncbi:RelA/SpoT family protein [Helicobacter kayseriensis]|uniref:RelA/SpoT family protein n=1 Tax=Helicobacter kayseriensis TaxID=2905877 RepID=UPI001E5736D0|nr:RelA/SpoT family protein [Helicobacter kayseriensis]MCE3047626.1 RelA/SpoT family protein [Helicobacter kayseriensis]MCE3049022.1 RelA/SpoT family protein [Helicobacter kayseriensis]